MRTGEDIFSLYASSVIMSRATGKRMPTTAHLPGPCRCLRGTVLGLLLLDCASDTSRLRAEQFNQQPLGFLSAAYGPSLAPLLSIHRRHAAPRSGVPLQPLHPTSDGSPPFAQRLPGFSSRVSEVKAASSSPSICTYTTSVMESGAKTSECKHSLDKSRCINMHNRRARSAQSTVVPQNVSNVSWLRNRAPDTEERSRAHSKTLSAWTAC